MSEPITPTNIETQATGERKVACDGPSFSKHPRVYLTMVDDADGAPVDVVCPYCSRVFKYDAALAQGGAQH
jgi:uncharacterized Zn-finger protein